MSLVVRNIAELKLYGPVEGSWEECLALEMLLVSPHRLDKIHHAMSSARASGSTDSPSHLFHDWSDLPNAATRVDFEIRYYHVTLLSSSCDLLQGVYLSHRRRMLLASVRLAPLWYMIHLPNYKLSTTTGDLKVLYTMVDYLEYVMIL
jgi:hypothetical protein